VRWLWIAYGVSVLLVLWMLGKPKMQNLGPGSDMRAMVDGVMIGMFIVLFALSAVLYAKLAAGRNWARIVYLVLNLMWIFSLPAAFFAVRSGASSPLEGLANLFNFGVSMYACYLLLTRESREWFRAKST